MTYIPNKGKTESVTMQPYIHTQWGVSNIVFVDNKDKHPDPARKLIWGYGIDGDVYPGDFKDTYEKVGKSYTFYYSVEGCWTAAQETERRIKEIRRFISVLGKEIEGKYIPSRERKNKPIKKKQVVKPIKKSRRWAVSEHNNYESEERYSEKPFDLYSLPKRELILLYLETKGYKVVPGRSVKYITLENPDRMDTKYFVGTNGGIWFGRNVSDKIGHSLSGATKEQLIKYLEKVGY
jgi:hypothetical protein